MNWKMVVLAVLLVVSIGINIRIYPQLTNANKTIASYQDIENLNQKSKDFIDAYVRGKGDPYLSSAYQKKIDRKLADNETITDTESQNSGLSTVLIDQLFTKKDDKQNNRAESYAVVKLGYKTTEVERTTDDYIQTLSIRTQWVKENNGDWKVDHLEMSAIGNTEKDELRRQAEEALENAKGGAS